MRLNLIHCPADFATGTYQSKNIEYGVKEGASRHETYYHRADFSCVTHFSILCLHLCYDKTLQLYMGHGTMLKENEVNKQWSHEHEFHSWATGCKPHHPSSAHV